MIEVKPDNILSVIKSLQNEGYKRATIVHSFTILKLMCQKAFDSKMIPSNPVQDIKLPARDYAPASNDVKKDLQCISVTQSETFFKACKDTRYYELFYLLIHTGMRIGEACAVKYSSSHVPAYIYYTLHTVRNSRRNYCQNSRPCRY